MIHQLIYETERVCFGRVHPHERYHIFVVKAVMDDNLIAEPLQGGVGNVSIRAVVKTYRDDLVVIIRHVTTI